MKKVLKATLGMVLVLGIPLCASAQNDTTVNRTAAEARQEVREVRQDMQDRKDAATMRNIQSKEDRQTTGEYLDDAAITAKVKGTFVGQKGLDSLDIKVVTVDGAVTLMGDVDNQSQIGLAENAAKQVEGVKRVDNQLVLKK